MQFEEQRGIARQPSTPSSVDKGEGGGGAGRNGCAGRFKKTAFTSEQNPGRLCTTAPCLASRPTHARATPRLSGSPPGCRRCCPSKSGRASHVQGPSSSFFRAMERLHTRTKNRTMATAKGGGMGKQGEEGRVKGGTGAGSKADALAALEAHFAKTFEVPAAPGMAQPVRKDKGKEKKRGGEEATEPSRKISAATAPPAQVPHSKAKATTIVFGEGVNGGASGPTATPGWRKFMSSKVMTKTDEEKRAAAASKAKKKGNSGKASDGSLENGAEEGDDEKEAQSNDRALSELLSTTLFTPSGSTTRSNGRPNLGSNDTLARLLELSQPSMTGKAQSQGRGYGEALLKSKDMSKMPATIRHGMRRVEMENQQREVERQKELGNYHHSIKGLIGKREGLDLVLGTKDKDRKKRTREKGLAMGVGKFAGGTLKLSEQEVQRISNVGSSSKKRRR